MRRAFREQLIAALKPDKKLLLALPFIAFTLIMFIIPLMIVVIKALTPVNAGGVQGTVSDNFAPVDDYFWTKIGKSVWISLAATALALVFSLPFCYFLVMVRHRGYKTMVILFATAPIWSSFLIKLIGLKSLFDLINTAAAGTLETNTTFGDGWTMLGIWYVYLPFMILPLYTVLDSMPKSYMLASRDLGWNAFSSFFLVVIPYCRSAMISGLILVLLPAFTTVAVPQFLNNANDSSMVGDYIFSLGETGVGSDVAVAQASAISLILGLFILGVYLLWWGVPRVVRLIKRKVDTGSFLGAHKRAKKLRRARRLNDSSSWRTFVAGVRP